MEMVTSRQDSSVNDSLSEEENSGSEASSPAPAHTQVSLGPRVGGAGDSSGVTLVQLPDGQTIQVHGVIQAPHSSVIQSPQIATVAGLGGGESEPAMDTQKRREILSRRPSYRKILNELSSDSPAVPKIEEENGEDETAASAAPLQVPTSIYQTSSGQYIAITQGGAIQLTSPGSEALQGAQTLTMPSSAQQPGATILQYAAQPGDSPQQFYMQGGQVLIQAATGDMPAYQLRSPTSGLPQGLVMAASPSSLHSPPAPHTEDVTRKREVRLMKNREAARECRRKKKEYVKCLENRVAVLENQNKTLIEELKALKDIYCHKNE